MPDEDEFTWVDATEDATAAEDGSVEIDWDSERTLAEVADPEITPRGEGIEEVEANFVDDVIAGFRARAGREAQRESEVGYADTYICVCFASYAQKQAFLTATRWDRIATRYVDGRKIAALMGIDLPADPKWPQTRQDKTFTDMAMTVAENEALPE